MIEQQPSRLGGLVHRSYIPRHPRSTRLGISLIANALRSYVHLSTDSRKHLHWAASLSICTGNNLAGPSAEVHRPSGWQLQSSTPTSIHRSGIYLAGATILSISQHLYTVDARYISSGSLHASWLRLQYRTLWAGSIHLFCWLCRNICT